MHPYWVQFAKVAVAHLLAVASPGPDFAMVLRQSIAHGRRAAVWTSVGIGTAILVHNTYALLGIGILLRAYPAGFVVMKLLAAGYLAWIAAQAFRSRPRRQGASAPGFGAADLARPGVPTPRAAWRTGFLTNVFNPKATLFFVALFTLIDPGTPRIVQASYGFYMSAATMLWFCAVSLFFTRDSVRRAFLRAGHWIDWAMGVVFAGFAVLLALSTVN